jgi:hypothetical protein
LGARSRNSITVKPRSNRFSSRAQWNRRILINVFEFASGSTSVVTCLESQNGFSLSVSPDARQMLYTVTEQREAALILVENFP